MHIYLLCPLHFCSSRGTTALNTANSLADMAIGLEQNWRTNFKDTASEIKNLV